MDSLDQLSGTAFTVNSTDDGSDSNTSDGICADGNGNCTLRAAIQEANRVEHSIIRFDVPGSGTRTIQPASALPTITGTVLIDGFSQPGATVSNYLVELDGTNAGTYTDGLTISGTEGWIRGLVLNRFGGDGIFLQGSGGKLLIEENRIGTDVSGTSDSGNGYTGVKVSDADGVTIRNNLISGNDSHGVELSLGADDAVISGNIIGANASAAASLGNTGVGIYITGGDKSVIVDNVIGGNASGGISLTGMRGYSARLTQIVDNLIGVNRSAARLGNGGNGITMANAAVYINPTYHREGATYTDVNGNIIAHNGGAGVAVVHDPDGSPRYSIENSFSRNSIHSNGGLGIDLNGDGVTANDAGDTDTGPNYLENYPVLTSAGLSSEAGSIGYSLYVRQGRWYSVDFFASDSCDSSGNGEGKEWLGSASGFAETSGDSHFLVNTFDGTLQEYDYPSGTYITATVTTIGSTSEFSPCIQSVALPQLTLSEDTLEAEEDATTGTTYTVRLTSQPSHDATVDLTIEGDAVATVFPTQLAFTVGADGNWQTPQTVTVTAVSDDDPVDEFTAIQHKLTIDSKEYVTARVPVEVRDDDVPPVSITVDGISGVSVDLSMNGGSSATYSVALTEKPAGTVVVDIDRSQTLQPLPTSLTFTEDNYSTAQNVTLTSTDAGTSDRVKSVRHRVSIDGTYLPLWREVVAHVRAQAFPTLILSEEAINVNEGETATYTIVPASEPWGNFTIRPESAHPEAVTVAPPLLSFTAGPDGNWQTPQTVTVTALNDDDGLDNVVPIRHFLSAFIPTGLSFRWLEEEVEVTVADGNRAPFFEQGLDTTRSIDENAGQGTAVGAPVVATDLNDDTLTYSIEDQEGGPYTVDSGTGQIRVGAGADLDYENKTAQEVTLKATDEDGLSDTIEVVIEIADVNEPPLVTGVSGSEDTTFPEDSRSTVGRFKATDPEGDAFEWSVDPTGDGRFFSIDSGGYLDFNDPPDFEDQVDANGDGVYEPRVVATDAEGNAGELQIKVTVTDVNEPPTVEGRVELALSENDDLFGRELLCFRPRGQQQHVHLECIRHGWRGFQHLSGRTADLRQTRPTTSARADSNRNNEYLVQVRASDGQYTGRLDVTVTVTDVNEPPTITGTESRSFPENSASAVATYRADDPEGGTITWSLSGDDRGDFNISETGVLTFVNIPDFEMPADANQDNEYLITVEARDDGINRATLDVTVTVTNTTGAEEPTITTTGNPSPYRENGTGAVYTFRARDPQGRPVGWTVTGTDSPAFEISSSGVLTFRIPPDFESPTDADRDNVYELTVVVTDDQGLTDSVDVTVTVTNDAEGVEPTISTRSPPATYRENGAATVYTFRATDPQRRPITWLLSGIDAGAFDLTDSGALTFASPPNFESPSDVGRDNAYELTVIATDEDGHTDRLSFTITVTDVNEGPEVSRTGSVPGSVPETYHYTQVLARYSATDPESPSTTITRWSTSGTDGGDFVMSEQGELRFRNQPDHERPADSNRDNVYVFTVRASDGRYYGEFSETVTVDDVNEPPTITTTSTSATALSQPENRTTRLYTYRATDPEGETITWSVGGVDGGFFAINERGRARVR